MAKLAGIKANSKSMTRSLQQSGSIWKVKRTLKMDYEVYASPEEPTELVALAPGIPRLGMVLPDTSGWFICKRVDPQEVSTTTFEGELMVKWIVSVEMDSDIESIDPTKLEPEVSWTYETIDETCRTDLDGKEVETVCHEPLPLTAPNTIPVLTINRYYLAEAFSPQIIYDYTNTVNSKTFWGSPAKHVLLKSITGKYHRVELPDGTKPLFFQATFTFKFKKKRKNIKEPWEASVMHYGNLCKDRVTGKIQQATSKPGNTPVQVKLSPEGFELGKTERAYYLKFKIYPEMDFGPLGINNTDIFH